MARIVDIVPAVRSVGAWTLLKRIIQQVNEDNVVAWAAALAYSWLFAIFPFVVVLLTLVPLIPERLKPNVREQVSQIIDHSGLPGDVSGPIEQQITGLLDQPSKGFLTVGLILTIYAASKGMAMTMAAIDKAYDVERGRPFWKQQPLAMFLTIAVATLVVLVMILMPVGTAVLHWVERNVGGADYFYWLINVARYTVALLLMFMVLAIIYHFGPSFRQKFVAITPGAVFCVLVWLLLGYGFRFYLTKMGGAVNYSKTYGTVAGAAILLLSFYLDALVLLVGAEINSELDFALGRAAHRNGNSSTPPGNSLQLSGQPDNG